MYETISVIIPSEDGSKHLPALECLRNVKYQENKIEIILATGNCPSCQRNKAVKAAKGDILYFLNKDSKVAPDIFNIAMDVFNRDENIAGAGGPDLTPLDNTYLQHLFGYALSSYFAHWKMKDRYSQVGKERTTNEAELILSNLAIRRDIFIKEAGKNKSHNAGIHDRSPFCCVIYNVSHKAGVFRQAAIARNRILLFTNSQGNR